MPRRLTLIFLFTTLIFMAARSETAAVRELAPGVFFWQATTCYACRQTVPGLCSKNTYW